MTKFKKVLSLLFVFVFAISNTLYASAQVPEPSRKTNFHYISTDNLEKVEYTYEEDGKTYKVVEHTNSSLTEITTAIYRLDAANKYVLVDNYTTHVHVKDNWVEITTTDKNNSTSVDRFPVKDVVEFSDTSLRTAKALKGWVHIYDYKGSVKFAKYTLSVVIATLCGAVASLSGITFITGGAVSGASAIAQIIVKERIPYAYIKQQGYYYYPTSNGVPTKMRHITKCYKKSNYTGYLGTTTSEGKIRLGGN